MQIKITEVFEFDELIEAAKEAARDWYREGALDHEWWDSTFEDAENAGLKITSFDLGRARDIQGKFTDYAESCAKAIVAGHGDKCETFKTAAAYLGEREKLITIHADAESSNGLTWEGDEALETLDAEFLKSILEDYWYILNREMEWQLADEQVDESIRANQYTFTAKGKRF